MFKYFQTTTLILLWCFVLALVWSFVVFKWSAWRKARGHGVPSAVSGNSALGAGVLLPALVLAPLLLVVAFRMLGINLLFPLHFFAEPRTLVLSAFVPAVVLVLASGLFSSISRGVRSEYWYWSQKLFTRVAVAAGMKEERVLRRLVITKAFLEAWSRSLPWLFGELIVVEAVFNAPGLGLDAWHLARTRDFSGLAFDVASLAMLYGSCVLVTGLLNRKLGKRLETYA